MSAETLRAAAEKLEALAEAAFKPWRPYSDDRLPLRWTVPEWQQDMRNYLGGEWGDYAAAMHPGVGKALASWLHETAETFRLFGDAENLEDALAVARQILGGDA